MWLEELMVFLLVLEGSLAGAGFHLVDEHGETVLEEKQGLLLYDGGTVCNGHSFGQTEVYAICREMGFDSEDGWKYGLPWPSIQNKYHINLADVHCLEPYWSMCTSRLTNPVNPECTHDNDVLMTCKGSIISCPPGMYRSYRICRQCPPNTYKAVGGTHTSCIDCPGSTTSATGSSVCSCRAGLFWNGTDCLDCPKKSISQEGASKCLECPPGSTATNEGSSCNCSSGMTWNWDRQSNGSCQPCLPGTYKNPLTTTCVMCPAGTTSTTCSEHCICKAGMFWNNTTCQDCLPGTDSQEGAFKCLAYPLRYSVVYQGNESGLCPSWSINELIAASLTNFPILLSFILILVVLALNAFALILLLILFIRQKKDREKVLSPVATSKYGSTTTTSTSLMTTSGEAAGLSKNKPSIQSTK